MPDETDRPTPWPALRRMENALRRRGPDDGGVWVAHGEAALVARRLAITDPAPRAKQPFTKGRLTLVFNGEIYNHADLRCEILRHDDRPFRTRSDTETIVRAYDIWGDGTWQRLNGMFAIALWDGGLRQLCLVRDRAGQKPLFWSRTGNGLLFASEPAALFATGLVRADVSPQAVADYLVLGATPDPDSFFSHVSSLPAAHVGIYRAGDRSPTTRPYWSVVDVLNAPTRMDAADLAEQANDALCRAVARSIPHDLRTAALLSGGIDSGLVAAELTRRSPPDRVALIHLAPGRTAEAVETEGARAVAAALASPLHIVRADDDLLLRAQGDLGDLRSDAPVGTADTALMSIVCRCLSARAIRVCLAGEGADEIGVYPAHLANRADPARRFIHVLEPEILARLWRGGAYEPYHERLSKLAPGLDSRLFDARLRRLAALEFAFRLPSLMLPRADAASMAHGVEIRCPFLDTTLVDLLLSAPAEAKVRGDITKLPFRDSWTRRFGPVRMGKVGFGHPFGPVQDRARATLREMVRSSKPMKQFLDVESFEQSWSPLSGYRLFALAGLARWLDRFAG